MSGTEIFDVQSKVAITLNQQSEGNIVPLYTYTPYVKAGYRLFSEWLEIKELKATAWIYSTNPVGFPVFELEDSESKQLLTLINLEWSSPRKQLDLMLSTNNGTSWQHLRSYSLTNPSPYPFKEYELGDHKLGDNALLGVRIVDVGFGLLRDINVTKKDRVTVYADVIRHVALERVTNQIVKIANTITSQGNLVVPANSNRTGISFFNDTNINVFLDVAPGVSSTSYMVKIAPGDYYEPVNQTYIGAYYAAVANFNQPTSLEIREYL